MGSYKNNGNPALVLLNRLCNSIPLIPGKRTSSIRHAVSSQSSQARNSSAEANVLGEKPAAFITLAQRFAKGFVIVDDGDDAGLGLSLIHFSSPDLRHVLCQRMRLPTGRIENYPALF